MGQDHRRQTAAERATPGGRGYEVFAPTAGGGPGEYEQAAGQPRIAKRSTSADRERPGHGRTEGDQNARSRRRSPPCSTSRQHAGVDHAGDEPPADALLSTTTERPADHQWSTRTSCGSCRSRTRTAMTSPSSRGQPAVAQEPPRQQRRRHDYPGRRRRPQPQFRDQVGLRQRGLVAQPRQGPKRGTVLLLNGSRRLWKQFTAGVGFEFFVNYHSAAELLLYGTGWQVSTPTPDDVIYEAMAGDELADPGTPATTPTSRLSCTPPTVTPTHT